MFRKNKPEEIKNWKIYARFPPPTVWQFHNDFEVMSYYARL